MNELPRRQLLKVGKYWSDSRERKDSTSHPRGTGEVASFMESQVSDFWIEVDDTEFLNYGAVVLVASLVAQLVKNPLAMQVTLVWFLGREDPLEKG